MRTLCKRERERWIEKGTFFHHYTLTIIQLLFSNIMHDFVYSLMGHFGKLTNHGILQFSVPIGRKTRKWREIKCSTYTQRGLLRWPFSRPRTSFRCQAMLPVQRKAAAGWTSGHNIRHGPPKPLGSFFFSKACFRAPNRLRHLCPSRENCAIFCV